MFDGTAILDYSRYQTSTLLSPHHSKHHPYSHLLTSLVGRDAVKDLRGGKEDLWNVGIAGFAVGTGISLFTSTEYH